MVPVFLLVNIRCFGGRLCVFIDWFVYLVVLVFCSYLRFRCLFVWFCFCLVLGLLCLSFRFVILLIVLRCYDHLKT